MKTQPYLEIVSELIFVIPMHELDPLPDRVARIKTLECILDTNLQMVRKHTLRELISEMDDAYNRPSVAVEQDIL